MPALPGQATDALELAGPTRDPSCICGSLPGQQRRRGCRQSWQAQCHSSGQEQTGAKTWPCGILRMCLPDGGRQGAAALHPTGLSSPYL